MVCLTAADGSLGWGEMSDLSHLPAMMPEVRDLELVLGNLLNGASPLDTNRIEDAMLANFPGTRFHGKSCLVRAGVSIAAHDLKARLLGVSLSDLLGGRRRTRVPICYPIFRMGSAADLPDRKRLVAEQVNAGFTHFRLYFGFDADTDAALMEWMAGEYGRRVKLTSMDGSGLFTLPQFMRAYRRWAKYEFESVESPVDRDNVDLIAEARRGIDHPVSEHIRSEEYAIRVIRARAVDIFNISITVAGGIQGMLRLFNIARAANLECLIGTTQELSVATAAQAHVGAVVESLDYASDPVGPALYQADVVREPVRFEGGALLVPDGVGTGMDVDPAMIRAIESPLTSVNDVKSKFARG
jgi:muconate cycloisomerase